MKRDLIVEIICRALGDDYFHETFINSISVHAPINDVQILTVTDTDGYSFSIEIKSLKKSDPY